MEHIILLMLFLVLIIGLWAFFYTNQAHRRYGTSLFKYLNIYIVTYNSLIFIYIILNYISINLLGLKPVSQNAGLTSLVYSIGVFVHLIMTISFILCIYALLEKSVTETFKRIATAVAAVFGFNFVFGIFKIFKDSNADWMINTYFGAGAVATICIYLFILYLINTARKESQNVKKHAFFAFGGLYFTAYSSYFISTLFSPPVNMVFAGIMFICINIIPLIWIKYFFSKYHKLKDIPDRSFLDIFSQNFNITARERELIELLLQGKTNNEIKDLLFISSNTVKNQLYNLYKKLNVKSRAELVYLITEAQKDNH